MSKTKKIKKMTNEELLEEVKKELAKQRPVFVTCPQLPYYPQPYIPYLPPYCPCPQPYKITYGYSNGGGFSNGAGFSVAGDPCRVNGVGGGNERGK